MDNWELYRQASTYINQGMIRTGEMLAAEHSRQRWMEAMLPDLGHPQRAFGAIHVAGTSGKGSVATMIAHILRAHGLRTGLHVSPYLQLATEKLWVDGLYASAEQFAGLVDWVRPVAEAWRRPDVPLHGMASVALCLDHFRRQQVELAVVEAGVGGRHDLTNVLDTRVAVITALGLDHLKTLGPDLASIAWHKAGIIQSGCRAVVLQGPAVQAATEQAQAVGADLRVLSRADFHGVEDREHRMWLDFRGRRIQLHRVALGMGGAFQAENAALALAAVEQLELELNPHALRLGLGQAQIPGRLERIQRPGCDVLLDGAHNPDKLQAMLSGVVSLRGDRPLHVVYGALGARSPDDPLRRLAALAASMIVTQPTVYQKPPRPAEEIAEVVRDVAPAAIEIEPDPVQALQLGIQHASRDGGLVLVTGSLYLCGEARELFYPARDVLRRRSSWW